MVLGEIEMDFRRLSQCTLEDAVKAWNIGFEGYVYQMDMTNEAFLRRIVNEDLSPELSIVAFSDEEPIGIVMSGTRMIAHKKVAWNGGTGIAKTHRGTGLSKKLMEEVLRIYEEHDIEIALLEALEENTRAIKLYQGYEYEIIENLSLLEKTISMEVEPNTEYAVERLKPEQSISCPYYDHKAPWQCQWQSVRAGDCVVVFDRQNKPIGFCLYKKAYNKNGEVEQVLIYQLNGEKTEIIPIIFRELLAEIVHPIIVKAFNVSSSSPFTTYLMEQGFKKTAGQVHMKRRMKS